MFRLKKGGIFHDGNLSINPMKIWRIIATRHGWPLSIRWAPGVFIVRYVENPWGSPRKMMEYDIICTCWVSTSFFLVY